jgi:hypothetical protein
MDTTRNHWNTTTGPIDISNVTTGERIILLTHMINGDQ